MQKRVLSGMRPTGRLHLGNYLGAAKGMIELQNNKDYEVFYMVADVHGITTPFDPAELRDARLEVVLDYLAAGLDPEKATLFLQSHVPAQVELSVYLASVVTVARMLHLPTYKEKIKQHPQNVTVALLNYPVLMAADILAYKAHQVPVGIDQEPHLEVAREIARKVNSLYGTDIPEPQRFATSGEYIPSLTGDGKMSKSVEGSYISMTASIDEITSALSKAPTDSGKGNVVPKTGPVANLLKFVELFEGLEKRKAYEDAYTGSGLRYSELKSDLAAAMDAELAPIRSRRQELAGKTAEVQDMLQAGAARASKVAQQTLDEVKHAMGLV